MFRSYNAKSCAANFFCRRLDTIFKAMPRIPDTEIERIKTETDLVALIQARGTSLQRKGANWTGLCPFHDDQKTPNLIVTPAKGLFRCMAAQCGKAGNVIQFVQWFDGLSFRHAFELLSGGGKAAFAQSGGQARTSTVPKLPCPVDDGHWGRFPHSNIFAF